MLKTTLRTAAIAVSMLGLSMVPVGAQTLDFPQRPIELVIPNAAGGGNDLTARVMSSVAPDYLGQPVIIRIRPGAGTVLGLSEVARSKADGHTLSWAGPHAIVIGAFNKVPLDFLEQLTPIAQMVDWQWWLVVNKDSPFNTLQEFLDYAKANPGKLVVANSGNLAVGHLPALELEQHAGVEFTHLPFDGGGPANASVLSGDADAVHAVTPAIVSQLLSGNMKALAITGKKRNPEVPGVPTYEEQGIPIYTGVNVGLVAPKDTPPEVVKFLEEAMRKISEDKTYIRLLGKLGDKPAYLNSADYRASLETLQKASQQIAKKLRDSGVLK